jgi:hypothetical protein
VRAFQDDLLLSAEEERLDPAKGRVPYSVGVQFSQKSSVRDLIEGLAEVEQHYVDLVALC